MSILSFSDKYCTYNYWYDYYNARNTKELCTVTDIYSGYIIDDIYTSYTTNSYPSYSDIISSDEYCTWDYGFLTNTEVCTTTELYANGDIISYTDVFYH